MRGTIRNSHLDSQRQETNKAQRRDANSGSYSLDPGHVLCVLLSLWRGRRERKRRCKNPASTERGKTKVLLSNRRHRTISARMGHFRLIWPARATLAPLGHHGQPGPLWPDDPVYQGASQKSAGDCSVLFSESSSDTRIHKINCRNAPQLANASVPFG